jgi:curli biogenesis system outer membrane secretion channel CsgG
MTRMKHIGLVLFAALLGASGAHAQEHATSTVAEGAAKPAMKHAAPACSDARPECAMTVFPAFDKKKADCGSRFRSARRFTLRPPSMAAKALRRLSPSPASLRPA